MKTECRAVIDVGTNSVKLLVAEVSGHQVRPLRNLSEVTRLGQGLHEERFLQPEAIARTAQVMAKFAKVAKASGPVSIRVVATCAAREASNRAELLATAKQVAGLDMEIISGEQEAEWVFGGVSSDPKLRGHPLLIVDVGGGSTEVILGDDSRVYYRRSFTIGALRLFELLKPADPPCAEDLAQCRATLHDFLHWEVALELESALRTLHGTLPRLVGTGGSAAVLARIISGKADEPDDLDKSNSVTAKQVCDALELLWSYSTERRLKIKGLPAKRADVILTGAAVFEAFMTRFDFPRLTVSRRGLRHGVLLDHIGARANQLNRAASHSNFPTMNRPPETMFFSPTPPIASVAQM